MHNEQDYQEKRLIMSILSSTAFRAFVVERVSRALDDVAYTQEYQDLIALKKEAEKDPNTTIKTSQNIESLKTQIEILGDVSCYMQGWRDGISSLLNSVAS